MMSNIFPPTSDRLGIMLFIAAALHLLLILGVSFEFNEKKKQQTRQNSLDVILVERPREPPKPQEKADFLAQDSQAGGGEKTPESRPTPASPASQPPTPVSRSNPDTVKSQVPPKQAITQTQSERHIPIQPQTLPEQVPTRPTASQLLNSRDREIVRLTAELERKTTAYANLPRRKSINASTKEFKYASYLDAWRRKVERVGNLNYPDEAKRQKLHGNMILHVAVKSDGSVEQVRVLRSSGHKILDDAAVRIVWLAAPYSPFPQEIRQETDILDITRTWQFTRSNQLGSH